MKTRIYFSLVLTLVLLAACQKNETFTNSPPNTVNGDKLELRTNLMSNSGNYILRTAKNDANTLASLRSKLKTINASETGFISALNMMFVHTNSADFVNQMNGQNVKIAADLSFSNPSVNAEPFLSGGDNPPSSADNDAFFPFLWGMDAINAPQAWNAGYRGAGVVVAVIDAGIYFDHPDLAPNLLISQGRNFVNLDELEPGLCASYPECNQGDPSFKLPLGNFSHATHVSGTIAAVDNNFGVIGVAPSAKIMPIKVLSDFAGFGLTSWIVKGIVYAADQNVDVINMSLGGIDDKGIGKGSNLVQEDIKAFKDAINYAIGKGVTVICAAGNSSIDLDHSGNIIVLPAGVPNAISVSAVAPDGFALNPTTNLDIPASYTNYGSSFIDVAAPGGDFDNPSSLWFRDMVLSTGYFNPGLNRAFYSFAAGTSMAAPHAAGVAALIIGKYGGNISPAQVKAKLKSGADDLGKPGKDPYYGFGRINAYNSVK